MIARPPYAARERGVALIIVLMAMALIVALTSGMIQHQSLRIYKVSHSLAQSQGQAVASGAEAFAMQILRQDFDEDQEENLLVDSEDEVWAQYSALVPIEDNGIVEVQINDLSGRINLNDLVDSTGTVNELTRDRLTRLLLQLEITTVRVEALIDWIDTNDQTVNACGAEDGEYLSQDPPYRAANQPFSSRSELRLIAGMTEEAYQKLIPNVSALPVSGAGINVNTAPVAVLQSLNENLTAAQIETVIAQRKDQRFENIQDFLAAPAFAGLGMKPDGLTIKSEFFDVASRITIDERTYRLVTMLYRDPQGELFTVSRDEGQKNLITKERFTLSDGS